VELNPDDAEEYGIEDGERIAVASRRGEIEIPAYVTDRVPEGTIFIPFHFAESAANKLTNPTVDPKSKIPELKVCAARIGTLD
jgi:anaerobic selenocysteine-containing dehydrogenase